MKITRYIPFRSSRNELLMRGLVAWRQLRHQAKTVAQLRDFVGKLGGLQTEHQSLRLRELRVGIRPIV